MPRTTIDIDPQVLRELKRRKRHQGKSLGRLVSELLTTALARDESQPPGALAWRSRRMGARVNIEDKEAMRRALDEA